MIAQSRVAVGVLVPMLEEYEVFLEVFRNYTTTEKHGRSYHVHDLPLADGSRCIISRVMADRGNTAAATEAGSLLADFDVELIVLAGIAGGTHDDVRLGDVVVADQIDDFQHDEKAGEAGWEWGGRVWPVTWRLTQFVNQFQLLEAFGIWKARVAEQRPEVPEASRMSHEKPSLHVRPIASGNVLVAQKEYRAKLLARNRKFAAVEMEGAGVAAATFMHQPPVEVLVVRGISDFADPTKPTTDKTGKWRRYAMLSAFEFVSALCRAPGFADLSGRHADGVTTQIADGIPQRLAEIATGYERLREAMPSSRQRSYRLDKLLTEVRRLARQLKPSDYDVAAHLTANASDGERIVAVALAQAADYPLAFFDPMIDVLAGPRSRFEQTESLRFFESIAYETNDAQRKRLADAITSIVRMPDTNLETDRELLSRLIQRRMRRGTIRALDESCGPERQRSH